MDLKATKFSNCIVVCFRDNVHFSHIIRYIVPLTSFHKSNMKGLNQLTGELFDSVDEARHALDELTLPKGYVTTIKWQQKVDNSKDGEVNAVNLQCSCNAVHNWRFK